MVVVDVRILKKVKAGLSDFNGPSYLDWHCFKYDPSTLKYNLTTQDNLIRLKWG